MTPTFRPLPPACYLGLPFDSVVPVRLARVAADMLLAGEEAATVLGLAARGPRPCDVIDVAEAWIAAGYIATDRDSFVEGYRHRERLSHRDSGWQSEASDRPRGIGRLDRLRLELGLPTEGEAA
jgi:hypothetical protein